MARAKKQRLPVAWLESDIDAGIMVRVKEAAEQSVEEARAVIEA